jgi:hypothetical protein
MAQKVRMKIFERMRNGKRRHVLTIHGVGKTKAGAKSNARRLSRVLVRRNIEMGYYDSTGFHPIRRSRDYSAGRAGERYRPRSRSARAAARKYAHKVGR